MNSNSLLFYGESKHYIDIPSAFGEAFITCPGLVPPMMKYPGAISCVLANLCTASSKLSAYSMTSLLRRLIQAPFLSRMYSNIPETEQ